MSTDPAPLPDYIQKTVHDLQARIGCFEQEILKCKEMVNSLLSLHGRQPFYEDLSPKESSPHGPIRRDQYFGQPLSTVVKDILMRRRAANQGPASVSDIYKAMVEGGYSFEAKDSENAKRGLRISLTKNSATFIKLPHGDYGLKEWYPSIREMRPRTSTAAPTPDEESVAEGPDRDSASAPITEDDDPLETTSDQTDDFNFAAKEEAFNRTEIKDSSLDDIPF